MLHYSIKCPLMCILCSAVPLNAHQPFHMFVALIAHQKFDDVEVCAVARGEDLTYSITLIESDCDDVVIGGDNISVLCRNVKNGMATATLEVCGGSFCKTANTSLSESLTCTHTHTHTLSLSLCHTHTLCHTLSLFLSLSCVCVCVLCISWHAHTHTLSLSLS